MAAQRSPVFRGRVTERDRFSSSWTRFVVARAPLLLCAAGGNRQDGAVRTIAPSTRRAFRLLGLPESNPRWSCRLGLHQLCAPMLAEVSVFPILNSGRSKSLLALRPATPLTAFWWPLRLLAYWRK